MLKKTFSFILAVVLAFSMMPAGAVFAGTGDPEDPIPLTLDTEKEITFGDKDAMYFTFTPGGDGVYVIYAKSSLLEGAGVYPYGEILGEGYVFNRVYNEGTWHINADSFQLTGGEEYTFTVKRMYSTKTYITIKKGVSFKEMSPGAETVAIDVKKDIELNSDVKSYFDYMLKFDITVAGSYQIRQEGLTQLYLFDAEGNDYGNQITAEKSSVHFNPGTYYGAYEFDEQNHPEGGEGSIKGSFLIKKAPDLKEISLKKREYGDQDYTVLYYGYEGDGGVGHWTKDEAGNPYFEFDEACIKKQFFIIATYVDGDSDIVEDSEEVTWKYDGRNFKVGDDNKVTVEYKGKKATGTITIKDDLERNTDPDAPELKPDNPVKVETTGYFWFTAPEKGTYYFYSSSKGKIDPYADLRDSKGNETADDDGMGDLNFLIKKEIDASERCYFRTYREANEHIFGEDPGSSEDGQSFLVTVSRTNPLDKAFDISRFDLKRKFIDLVLVLDSAYGMREKIKELKDGLPGFVDALSKTGVTVRIALIDYTDITDEVNGDKTEIHKAPGGSVWFGKESLSSLSAEFDSILKKDKTGNFEECAVDALGNLISGGISFDPRAGKFAFLVTNSGNKDKNTHGLAGMEDLTGKLKAANIPVSVMTGKVRYTTYMDLSGTTGGVMTAIDNKADLSLGQLSLFIAEYTDRNVKPDHITRRDIGNTGYKIAFTDTVFFNGASHINEGGKTSKKKTGDIVIKITDPSGAEVAANAYKVKFKKNKNASENGPYFTIKMKKADKAVKTAFKAEKFRFVIRPLDLSSVTLTAKKVSDKKITGLYFKNEAGGKIKMKPVKRIKGDYKITGTTEDSVIIEGHGNYTGKGTVKRL